MKMSDHADRGERIKHDKECLNEIFNGTMNLGWKIDEEIAHIKRIKKRDGENGPTQEGKPPAMKVTLKNPNRKKEIFRNLSKLQGTTHEEISVRNDLTQKQREEHQKLVQEAKEKERQDPSGKARFRVNGPPWALKIVEVKGQ